MPPTVIEKNQLQSHLHKIFSWLVMNVLSTVLKAQARTLSPFMRSRAVATWNVELRFSEYAVVRIQGVQTEADTRVR